MVPTDCQLMYFPCNSNSETGLGMLCFTCSLPYFLRNASYPRLVPCSMCTRTRPRSSSAGTYTENVSVRRTPGCQRMKITLSFLHSIVVYIAFWGALRLDGGGSQRREPVCRLLAGMSTSSSSLSLTRCSFGMSSKVAFPVLMDEYSLQRRIKVAQLESCVVWDETRMPQGL